MVFGHIPGACHIRMLQNCSVVQEISLSPRGVGLMTFKFPFQTKLFYDSMAQSTLCVCQDILGPQNMPWCLREAGEQWRELPGMGSTCSTAGGLGKGVPSLQKRQENTHQGKKIILEKEAIQPSELCSWEWNANLLFLGTLSSPQESRQKADG